MPRFPEFSQRVSRLPAPVFDKFRPKMKQMGDKIVHLHIGDSYLQPDYPLPIEPHFMKKHPDFNRYCNTMGLDIFREVLLGKLKEDNALVVDMENILVTCGATNALSASVAALLNPDEETLVLTPCWPFFPGMVKMADAKVIEIPFYTRLFAQSDLNIYQLLSQYLTPDTTTIYLNTANNPSGKVLNRKQLQQVADFAREHNLWIISDEAYDGLTFDGHPYTCIATLPGMFNQTVSIFTFSKSFMFAGVRLGYLVAREDIVQAINKTMVHQLYSPATISQYMMIEPIKQRHSWIPKLCRHYQDIRDRFISNLHISVPIPEATYFLFFPIKDYLNGRDYWEVIEELLNSGVSVAPGNDFGAGFEYYIRLCFTGEPPERLEVAVRRINEVLDV